MAYGFAGIWAATGTDDPRATLERMRELVRRDVVYPFVVQQATDIVRAAAPRDQLEQASAIRDWIAMHFRFIPDIRDVELLRSPGWQIQVIQRDGIVQGDCDDAAMLGAALGLAVGIPAVFEARAYLNPKNPYQHVVTILSTRRGPFELDTTRPNGLEPPAVAKTLRVRV